MNLNPLALLVVKKSNRKKVIKKKKKKNSFLKRSLISLQSILDKNPTTPHSVTMCRLSLHATVSGHENCTLTHLYPINTTSLISSNYNSLQSQWNKFKKETKAKQNKVHS